MAALSCCPRAVIVMRLLTRNPNYNSMKPCECMDLCACVISVCAFLCVCLRTTERERRKRKMTKG